MSIKQDISEQYNSKPLSLCEKYSCFGITKKSKIQPTLACPNLLGNLVQDIHESHNLL